MEGNLFIVNKNLIEAIALALLIVLPEKGWGLYALSFKFKKDKKEEAEASHSRREAIKNLATIPALGRNNFV